MQRFIRLFAVFLFVALGTGPVSAQDATPSPTASLLAGQGFPELSLTVDDNGLVDPPSGVDAGRYLVTLDNTGSQKAAIDFVGVTDSSTYDQTAELYTTAQTDDAFPDAVYDTPIAGGTSAPAGDSRQVIVDLTPGAWVLGFNLESNEGDTTSADTSELMVTGTFPTVDDPTTDVEVGMYEMGFDMPDQIDAGPMVWHLSNTGDQPHFIDIVSYPEPFTVDQALAAFTALFGGGTPEAGTPDPNALDPSRLQDVDSSSLVSSGLSEWTQFDLAPGNYIALCFIPDRETSMPHALMGMAKTFTVS